MTQKLLVALAILTSACDADAPREGQALPPSCPDGKCDDHGGTEEPAAACWNEDPPAIEVDDAGICERLTAIDPALIDRAQGFDRTIFAPGNHPNGTPGCWARIDNPGEAANLCDDNDDLADCQCAPNTPNCWVRFNTETLDLAAVLRSGFEADDACYFLGVAQRRCRGELPPNSDAACDTASSCTPGLEIDCVAYDPPWIGTGRAAPQSRCTGVTVNGLGYANVVGHDLYGTCQPGASSGTFASCEVFGQTHSRMDPGLCSVLRECVEPAIACARTQTSPAEYEFASGTQTIAIDLVCGQTQTQGNHRSDLCRAVDINVTANGGNIDPAGLQDPEANLAPEFVAVMEECGLRWGGRFNGTYERMGFGCDPMHFDYAGTCVPERDPPAGVCE